MYLSAASKKTNFPHAIDETGVIFACINNRRTPHRCELGRDWVGCGERLGVNTPRCA